MSLNAAIWASSTALTGKAALAFWAAAFLFQCFDGRKLALAWQILLIAGAGLCGGLTGSQASTTPTMGLWLASAAIAGLSAVMKTRQWSQLRPSEVFTEASQLDPSTKKNKAKAAQAAGARSLQSAPRTAAFWIELVGVLAAVLALAWSVYAAAPPVRSAAWLSAVHAVAACGLWGVGIFCALELTFGSAPSSLAAVSWSGVAAVAILCWLAEACVAAAMVLAPIDPALELQAVAVVRLFAVSILLLDFVVWMIPQRVAHFQRSGKATAWVSLALAAWIGTLSLGVLCALPSSWPWSRL